jgi:hypothetical protein
VHFQGYVFSNEPRILMDSLIHVDGHPPGDVWLPLDVAADGARSGWIAVQPADQQPGTPGPSAVDEWVNCVWPTAFLRKRLGPLALLGAGALTASGVCRRNVRFVDGDWFAAVPRFFGTIGDSWSFQYNAEHGALVTHRGEATWTTTVRELDLAASLDLDAPALVVGPEGPVFYEVSFTPEEPRAYRARLAAAAAPLMDLPPDTCVWLVDWHE